MFDIHINARTADGTKLNTVYLRHPPRDAEKIVRLRESMLDKGWRGRPVLLADCGDHHRAFTGTHRLCAAQGFDNVIEAVFLPENLTAEDWGLIDDASDDKGLIQALKTIAETRDDMGAAVAVMIAEYEAL